MTREKIRNAPSQHRRTFLQAIAAGSLSVGATGFASGVTAGEQASTRELIQVRGGEGDLGRELDQGHYYYDPSISGDFDLIAHCMDVEHTHDWAKAGIMVRESLDPRAPHLMVRRVPEEGSVLSFGLAQIQWRPEYDAEAEIRINTMRQVGIRAEWLRLQREDDTFRIYGSMTGTDWTQFGEFTTDEIALGDDVFAGLAVTSGEYEELGLSTATFKDLSGFSPSENQDLDEPTPEGSVTVRDDVPITDTEQPDLSPASMTLNGSIYLPDDLDSAYCYFQYREITEDEWTTTETERLTSSGSFSRTVEATSRRLYEVRARAAVPGAPDIEAVEPIEGATLHVSTPSRGDGGKGDENRDTSLSAGVSELDLDDGFAEAAPWLDDDTPVIKVTEPTREALDEAFNAYGERLIVFETSGVIDLEEEDLSIRNDKCLVAGQTAPSPGITLVRGSVQIAADDCVVQHLRFRPGDAGYDEEGWAPDGIEVQDERLNNVIDHCTMTWGIDENSAIGGLTQNNTISNCLMAEALAESTHPEGIHSYGSLINPDAENVALLGNIWAFNVGRNPRLRLASTSVVANNLTYYYDDGCWMDPQARASIVGNQYLSPQTDQPNVFTDSLDYGEGIPKAYLEDNATDGDVPMVGENVEALEEPPLWPDGLDSLSADEVRGHNLTNAGARPADRTAHDERIIDRIRNGDDGYVDSQEDVGGYPDLPENNHSLKVPESGTHGWLREWARRVEDADFDPGADPEVTHYQVDFVEGEPIEEQTADESGDYSLQNRSIRFLHGSSEEPVTRTGAPTHTLDDSISACLTDDLEHIWVDDGQAMIEFTIHEGCELTLSLASYEKVGPGWSRERQPTQEFVDAETDTFGPGTHTLTVDLPNDSDDEN